MRRLLALALAPLLVSAADPVSVAMREAAAASAEQQRLEQAAAEARGAARQAATRRAAEAQAILAADARIALAEAQLAALDRRQALLAARLAEARRPATALLAGLAEAGRRPAWLLLANAGGADEQVRLAALVRALAPEVERRSAGLRQEAEALAGVVEAQRDLKRKLGEERQASAAAQKRFAESERQALAAADAREAEAFAAGDEVLDRGERLSQLSDAAARQREARSLAGLLAKLPEAQPRPTQGEGGSQPRPIEWSIPAGGAVTLGMGELRDNGVRTRGITIAAARGTQVLAPAPGKVVFAGPFRRREGLVIIDHGKGFATLLTEVRPSVRVGETVGRGQKVGVAMGSIGAELFQNGNAQGAALLVRP